MSVQEIMERVADLVSVAKPYMDRIDVSYAVADCVQASQNMNAMYNTMNYSVSELERLKNLCNADYVRLEYVLAFLPEQHENYAMRSLICRYYDKATALIRHRIPIEEKMELLLNYSKLSNLRASCCDSNFDYKKIDMSGLVSLIDDYERRFV